MEKVEMMQRSFENYLRVKPGKIAVDIILADGKRIEGIRRIRELKKESQRSPFFSAKMQAYGIGFPENGRCFSR